MKAKNARATDNARSTITLQSFKSKLGATVLASLLMLAIAFLLNPPTAQPAYAETDDGSSRPSVLLVDSSLGDLNAFKLNWLGDKTEVVANKGDINLLTTDAPLWWSALVSSDDKSQSHGTVRETPAPATFLLGSTSQRPIEAADIIWALDEIAKSGAQPKTFIVAVGASGLQARLYAEDLAQVTQSSRADLVGMAFFGTPQQGYSQALEYQKLSLWPDLASASNLEAKDVLPNSDFLNELNSHSLPSIVKSLQVNGSIGDMGFGSTDGAAVQSDFDIPQSVSTQIQSTTVRSTISQQVGLSFYWMPYSNKDRQDAKPVDANIAERLSAMESYVTSVDVQIQTREFYDTWFADGAPVTHISSVLTLDLSGSMLETLGNGQTKLEAAKQAANDYLQVVDVRSGMPCVVPTDVTVLGFDTSVTTITTGTDKKSREAVNKVKTGGDTDVGKALQASLDALSKAPANADKRILFLSDGMSTAGMSNDKILSGPVKKAKAAGVPIDTVAFGKVDQSDIDFLKEIAKRTGGNFYESTDTYSLKVSFLKAYYSALGLNLVDTETNPATEATTVLGNLSSNTLSLEIGVLVDGKTPGFKILCNGAQLTDKDYTSQMENDGLLTIQLKNPAPGQYSLVLDSQAKRAHVFAVEQLDLLVKPSASIEAPDNTQLYIIAIIVAFSVAVILVVVFTLISRGRSKKAPAKTEANMFFTSNTQGTGNETNTSSEKKADE